MALFLMRFYGETGGELKPLEGQAAQPEITITPPDETTDAGEVTDTTETDGTDSSSDSADDVEESAGK